MTETRFDPMSLHIFGAPPDAPGGPAAPPPPDISLSPAPPTRRGVRSLAGPVGPAAPAAPVRTGPAPARGIDWREVAQLRGLAADRLVAVGPGEDRPDPAAERARARDVVDDLLLAEGEGRLYRGQPGWTVQEREELAAAVFDALFGLGRLQPLVDDDTVDNIHVIGTATWVERTDGTLERGEPVADSDEELQDYVSWLATRSERSGGRSFSPANPNLHLRLDGGARLAASSWVTAAPTLTVRRHRLRRVTLDDLVGFGTLSPVQASFLAAAVRAGLSVVVAGSQNAGKTTLTRALCREIPRWEVIGTFETEFELLLHEMPDVHPIVKAWEERPGSGELRPDGRRAGQYTVDEALYDSFRHGLSRQIVGEVRGREVWAMIKAMESGPGSISTTHASSAADAMHKLVTCAMEAGPQITRELATEKLASAIDVVVHVHLDKAPVGGDRYRVRRWASEVVHVAPGEAAKGYALTRVFVPDPSGAGPGVPHLLPDLGGVDLRRHGFDPAAFLAAAREEV